MRRLPAALVAMACLGAAACGDPGSAPADKAGAGPSVGAVFEPEPATPAAQEGAVIVAADGGVAEQAVLAEAYAGALGLAGRETEVRLDVPLAGRVDAVRSGAATLSFGCTGELLALQDPARARELADAYAADDDPGKATSAAWRDEVTRAMNASLPADVMATDPADAQACTWLGEDPELPQYLVPFYAKPALTRATRVAALNRIAGTITTDDIRGMSAEAGRPGADPAGIAGHWLRTGSFAEG